MKQCELVAKRSSRLHINAMNGFFLKTANPAAFICVTGEDAAEFLQSQLSNEVEQVADGSVTHALLLNLKGKIEGDCHALRADEEQYWLYSERTPAGSIISRFEKYIIADDVELENLSDGSSQLTVYGEALHAAAEHFGLAVPDAGSFARVGECFCFATPRAESPALEVIGPVAALQELAAALESAGCSIIDAAEAARLRISAGIPAVLADATADDFPQECGPLAELVSYRKGCYLGQEIMAGLRKTGRTTRGLCRVVSDGKLPENAPLFADGKQVGELRSTAKNGTGAIALAMLRRKVLEAAPTLALSVDGSGEIRILSAI